jgi:hypothetical protein
MTTDEKIDEILMALRGLEARFGFIEEDLNVLKEGIVAINDTTVTIALNGAAQGGTGGNGGGASKSARVAEFQKESARW